MSEKDKELLYFYFKLRIGREEVFTFPELYKETKDEKKKMKNLFFQLDI